MSPFANSEFLDVLHHRLRANFLAYRLVIGTRILLCAGFLPTGIVKMLGRPFTIIDPSTLIPATAQVGAILFFPIIFNNLRHNVVDGLPANARRHWSYVAGVAAADDYHC